MPNDENTHEESFMPTTFVLFGATGDLARRKIIPSLFRLFQKDQLPEAFTVLGFARSERSDDDFRALVRDILHKSDDVHTAPEDEVAHFTERFFYQNGLFEEEAGYTAIAEKLHEVDRERGLCSNRLFYLAVPPHAYKDISEHLASSGLTAPCSPEEGWTRVIVEKPFGSDRTTAQEIDAALGKLFDEQQIYRIDHYLGKEMVQNILAFRFSNNLFERTWDKDVIESITVRLNETIDAEGRGSFYDAVGALRDVGQNHLLQILALLTMETPSGFTADAVREKRLAALQALPALSDQEIRQQTYRAQYDDFPKTEGVRDDSDTETYFAIETELTIERFAGVRVVLEGGKALREVGKEAVVTFRHPTPCLCPPDAHYNNTVTFRLGSNDEGIIINFVAKTPGVGFQLEERAFDFTLHEGDRTVASSERDEQHSEDYEALLLDCIRGDQTLFVSTEEVAEMWRFIDPVVEAWQDGTVPLEQYEHGTTPAFNF